jgi:hypothetical protein
MPDDAVRHLAHGVCWQVRIAKPMAARRAAGPDGYRRRTAGTWYAANTAMVKGVHAVELAPGGKRPVTERRGPARQARIQARRIRLIGATPRPDGLTADGAQDRMLRASEMAVRLLFNVELDLAVREHV